jgi:hypothetical protein
MEENPECGVCSSSDKAPTKAELKPSKTPKTERLRWKLIRFCTDPVQ